MNVVYPWMEPIGCAGEAVGEVGETWLAVWLWARRKLPIKNMLDPEGFRTHHHPSNSCHTSNGNQRVFWSIEGYLTLESYLGFMDLWSIRTGT